MNKLTAILGTGLTALAGSSVIRAWNYKPIPMEKADIEDYPVDVDRVLKHLAGAIQCKTISTEDDLTTDWSEFDKFHDYLDKSFPLIAKNCEKEIVGKASLIYRWPGKDSALEPMAFLSHQDVVPVAEGTEQDWDFDPWEGHCDGTHLYGRGALDMKNHLICVMEAVESLMEQGFRPDRDVYLLFGHNEEMISSTCNGAQDIADTLKARGIRLDSTLDEGGAVLKVQVPMVIDTRLSAIGIGEKGQVNMKITLNTKGGHSSVAPYHSGMNDLADTIKDLEKHQFESRWLPFMSELVDRVARYGSLPVRAILVNFPVLRPLVQYVMTKIPEAASLVRTVYSVTMAEGSMQPNVLPQRPSITVNFRPLKGDSIDDCERHVREIIRYPDFELERWNEKEATELCSTTSRAYRAIEKVQAGMYPGHVAVVPYLVMGGTDSWHYADICDNCLRYAPFNVSPALLKTTHGTNERIPVDCVKDAVIFFREYCKLVSSKD